MAAIETDLEPAEVRVLGCLLEKQRLTPDGYPLTLNSLRLACNQATSRDPVVDYEEATIREALARLTRRGYARLASGQGSRAAKYRHLWSEALGLSGADQALMAILMLRGAQTPGELRARSDRLHAFSGGQLETTLAGLCERGLAGRLERRPGQKEERYAHRLSESARTPAPDPATPAPEAFAADPGPEVPSAHHRIERLEGAISKLRGEVLRLRGELDRLRDELGDEGDAHATPTGSAEEGVD